MNKIHSIVWNAPPVDGRRLRIRHPSPSRPRGAVPCFARCSWPSLSRWHGAAPQVQRRCSSPAPRLMLPMARGLSRTSLLPMAPPASSLATAVRWSSREMPSTSAAPRTAPPRTWTSAGSHYVFDNASLDFNVGGRVMGGTRDQTGAPPVRSCWLRTPTSSARRTLALAMSAERQRDGDQSRYLRLGQNNTINADSITLGGNQSGGTLVFQDSVTDGTLTCVAPTGRAP